MRPVRIPPRRVSLPRLDGTPAEKRWLLAEDNARVRARAVSANRSDGMRLAGVGLCMALQARPVAPALVWQLRVRALEWRGSVWAARERFALPVLILIAAVACAVVVWAK